MIEEALLVTKNINETTIKTGYKLLEEVFHNVKELFESCVFNFKMFGYNDANIEIRKYNNMYYEQIYTYEISINLHQSVFLLKYNIITTETTVYYCNKTSYGGEYINSIGPKNITNIKQLKAILIMVNLENEQL